MSQYLINIAVGPVQEFIASARKLRDLWYGSHLLSELAKAVAASLHEQGCDLIFPTVTTKEKLTPNSDLNVANKILAVSPMDSDPVEITRKARESFQNHWRQICQDAVGKAPNKALNKQVFDQQVNDFGEFFAAWVPYIAEQYQDCRRLVEQKLSGRKSLRNFTAPTWKGKGLPKSSLDGIREAVLSGIGEGDRRCIQLKKGEHLDTLGVVKRFGPWNNNQRPHFDNMAQVAAWPYIIGLHNAAQKSPSIAKLIPTPALAAKLYPEGNSLADKRPWDDVPEQLSSELFHPSVLADELQQVGNDSNWNKLHESLRALWKVTAQPMPYGCLLLGDGDNMGKALDSIKTQKGHQEFSDCLGKFAQEVHTIATEHNGKVIYSGGDDVMAYAPLHSAVACATAFNDFFRKTMTSACASLKIQPPTFSLGLVIIHHHNPLHKALDLARHAERYAKDKGGRDCLSIIQDKRGGSPLTICGKWSGQNNLPERLERFIKCYCKNRLSSRLAYQLRAITKQCGEILMWKENEADNAACAEALRLIGRKQNKSTKTLLPDDAVYLIQGQTNLRQISDELVIAHQLAQAVRLAAGDWTKEEV